MKDNGYEVDHDGKCITVFSAPNYWFVYMIVLQLVFMFYVSLCLHCMHKALHKASIIC